jgi:23S rRNA pseudouridine1911/1915/1917 synthase
LSTDSSKQLELTVTDDSSGLRLDKYLSALPEVGTRSKAAKLIELNLVCKNGQPLKSSYRVQTGDRIEVKIPPPTPTDLQPLELPLDIVYQDADCLVVNKPAGLVVHPAAGHAQDTLVNALVAQVKELSMGFGEHRPGIVHRLDKDTSGLLAIAKNDFSHEKLALQFKHKTVLRHYWALVYGEPKTKRKTIESFLARHPVHRKKFSSQSSGKRAITTYEVLKSKSGISLLRCRLETGRTHQIRVHLSEMGHPIVGDRLYGSTRPLQSLGKTLRGNVENWKRIGLHAYELGFTHPRRDEVLKFFASWPEDLKDLIDQLEFWDVSTPTP